MFATVPDSQKQPENQGAYAATNSGPREHDCPKLGNVGAHRSGLLGNHSRSIANNAFGRGSASSPPTSFPLSYSAEIRASRHKSALQSGYTLVYRYADTYLGTHTNRRCQSRKKEQRDERPYLYPDMWPLTTIILTPYYIIDREYVSTL